MRIQYAAIQLNVKVQSLKFKKQLEKSDQLVIVTVQKRHRYRERVDGNSE